MSTSGVFYGAENEAPVARIRGHAALVRTLLDELERVAPPLPRSGGPPPDYFLCEQIAEEIARLGRRLMDCAAAIAGLLPGSTHGHAEAREGGAGAAEPPDGGCDPDLAAANFGPFPTSHRRR